MWSSSHNILNRPADWSADFDSPDLTDDDFIPMAPGGIPLPEATLRRLEGYNSQSTLSRHFARDNRSILQGQSTQVTAHTRALLPPGAPIELSQQLKGVFEEIKDLPPTSAHQTIDKISLDSDRRQLLAHYTAHSHANNMQSALKQQYAEKMNQPGFFGMALVPSNLDDPLAWAQLPLAEAQHDIPTSPYSQFVQARIANGGEMGSRNIRNPENLTLFETANPFYYAQQNHSRELNMDAMRANLASPLGSDSAAPHKVQEWIKNSAKLRELGQKRMQEERLGMLTNVSKVQDALRGVTSAIKDVSNQLTAASLGPQLNLGQNSQLAGLETLSTGTVDSIEPLSTHSSSSSSSSSYGGSNTLPSHRHQLMINLSSLKTHKTSLEQQFKKLTQASQDQLYKNIIPNTSSSSSSSLTDNSDNMSFSDDDSDINQRLYDLTDATTVSSTNSDTTHARPKQTTATNTKDNQGPTPAEEWSYLSYLNPWAYTSTPEDNNTHDNKNDITSNRSLATTASTSNASLLSSSQTGQDLDTFSSPHGYNVSLPNSQYLHIDIAHLNHLDQGVLKSRELLEDCVAVLFSNPSFISAFWDYNDINSFVELYNTQEDSRWNLYKQLLHAWYLSKFNNKDDKNGKDEQQQVDYHPQDGSRITSDTWNHLSTELKQFKAMMDVQFLGIVDQVREQKAHNGGKPISSSTSRKSQITNTDPTGLPVGFKPDDLDTSQSNVPFYITPSDDTKTIESKLRSIFFAKLENLNNNFSILNQQKDQNSTTKPLPKISTIPLPAPEEFTSVAYYEPYTRTDLNSLPHRFECIKSIFIHLFNTNRLSDDYRIMIDIDLTNIAQPQYIFLDPINQSTTRTSTINQPTSSSTVIQGRDVSLTRSPTSTLLFDPEYGQKIVHWTEKPWAKDIITQRRSFLESSQNQTDSGSKSQQNDPLSQMTALQPGSDGYLPQKLGELHQLQDSMSLPRTDLPQALINRHNEVAGERTRVLNVLDNTTDQKSTQPTQPTQPNSNDPIRAELQRHFQLSPAAAKMMWAEDEKSINLLVLAQQRSQLNIDPTTTSPDDDQSLTHFNTLAKFAQIPSLFHPLHGLDRFLSTQQSFFASPTTTTPESNSQATPQSFLGNFISDKTPGFDPKSQTPHIFGQISTTKRDIQLFDYLNHFLTQQILQFVDEYPHLQFVPINSPLGFVQGDLLPPINPVFSLVPALVNPDLNVPPFQNPKFRQILHFINTSLLAAPTTIPSTLQLLNTVKEKRDIVLETHEDEKNQALLYENGHILTKMQPKIRDQSQRLSSPFAYTQLTTPILDNPVMPHPRDFRAILLWDSLDAEQRRVYNVARRPPKTGATAWQNSEFSRPGLERHPFNRAYVRGDDSYADIINYKGGIPNYTPGVETPVNVSERLYHYQEWCDIYPEQAFNRQVIDMVKDHAYIASHPSMKEYLRRRMKLNFGQIRTDNSQPDASTAQSKWDSDVEDDGDDTNAVGAALKDKKTTNKRFEQQYNQAQFDDLDYIFSPDELQSLGGMEIPAELLEHPFTKVYVQHQSKMYKSRYIIASKIVGKQLANIQASYRSNYMKMFKKELGLGDSDLKIHTNDRSSRGRTGSDDVGFDVVGGINDDEDDLSDELDQEGGFLHNMLNSVRTTLGLSPLHRKSYNDPNDDTQFPYIFGIPTIIQNEIEKQLKPKSSETIYLENVPLSQDGATKYPLLKPNYSIESITPLTPLAVDNINAYIAECELKEKKRLGSTGASNNQPDNSQNLPTKFTPHPRAVLNQPISGPLIDQLTGTVQMNRPGLGKTKYDAQYRDEAYHDSTDLLLANKRLYAINLEPYKQPTYLDKLNYYDQSFYLFGLSPWEADQELKEKYEHNADYITKRHAADEHGMGLYHYMGMVQSSTSRATAQKNLGSLERRAMLEQLINTENIKLQTNLEGKLAAINAKAVEKSYQAKLSDRIKDVLAPFANYKLNPLDASNSRYVTPSGTSSQSRSLRTLKSNVMQPEHGNEDILDENDLNIIKYRNGLIQELDSLPLLSNDGTNISFIQSLISKELGELPFDPQRGDVIGSHLGLGQRQQLQLQQQQQQQQQRSNEPKPKSRIEAEKETQKELETIMDPIFRHIHAFPLSLDAPGDPVPVIVASPYVDPQTGEEYLQFYESRVTTGGQHVWKQLEWDQSTGELTGDSIEEFDESKSMWGFLGAAKAQRNKTHLVTFTRSNGSTKYKARAELVPRHFTNVWDVFGKKNKSLTSRDRSDDEENLGRVVFDLDKFARRDINGQQSRHGNGNRSGDGNDQDEERFESLENFKLMKSGKFPAEISERQKQQEKKDKTTFDELFPAPNPHLSSIRYRSGDDHRRHLDLQLKLRRDQPEENLSGDPFLSDMFEREFGEEHRTRMWKRQDAMLMKAQRDAGYEDPLVPNHEYDHLFTGHYRDYIIDPENDSEDVQQEKVIRRRLLVRPLPTLPERELTPADIISTPRKFFSANQLNFAQDPMQLHQRLQLRQLEQQTKAELWKRQKREEEHKRTQQQLVGSGQAQASHFDKGLAKDFGLVNVDTRAAKEQMKREVAIREWSTVRQEILVRLNQFGVDLADFDRNPDYYIDIYQQIEQVMAQQRAEQQQNDQQQQQPNGSASALPINTPQLSSLLNLPSTLQQYRQNDQQQSIMQVASHHLYNTLFGNNSNTFNIDPQQHENQLKLKQQLQHNSNEEQKVESYRRALLTFGVLPQEFDSLFNQRRQSVLTQHSKSLQQLLRDSKDAQDGVKSTPSPAQNRGLSEDVAQFTNLTPYDREQLGKQLLRRAEAISQRAPDAHDIYNIVFDLSQKSLIDVQDRLTRQKSYNSFNTKRRDRLLQQRRLRQQVDPLGSAALSNSGQSKEEARYEQQILDEDPFSLLFDPFNNGDANDPVRATITGGGLGAPRSGLGALSAIPKPRRPHDQSIYYRNQIVKSELKHEDISDLLIPFRSDPNAQTTKTMNVIRQNFPTQKLSQNQQEQQLQQLQQQQQQGGASGPKGWYTGLF